MEPLTTEQESQQVRPRLHEQQWRQYLAAEAQRRGSASTVAREAGGALTTVKRGLREREAGQTSRPGARIGRLGAGRNQVAERDPTLRADLEQALEPKGDPMSLVRWTTKSLAPLGQARSANGHRIKESARAERRHAQGFSLHVTKKRIEGPAHPDRDAPFAALHASGKPFAEQGAPSISVDGKKKARLGRFKPNGREWQAKGEHTRVKVDDVLALAAGQAIPSGVDDLVPNRGCVHGGIDHETAEFAVERSRRWWQQGGKDLDPGKHELLITADGGGSNGVKNRLWKQQLQDLATAEPVTSTGAHDPPASSTWTKSDQRRFSFLSINWRATPLTSLEVVLELISHPTTKEGFVVRALKDRQTDPPGRKVSDEELAALNLVRDAFHGEWNYPIKPQAQ